MNNVNDVKAWTYPKIKCEIIDCRKDGAEYHEVDGELRGQVRHDLQEVELADHRHQDRKST